MFNLHELNNFVYINTELPYLNVEFELINFVYILVTTNWSDV
jgi:hypothetical protein